MLRRVQIIHFILWTKSDKIINANMCVVVRVCVSVCLCERMRACPHKLFDV